MFFALTIELLPCLKCSTRSHKSDKAFVITTIDELNLDEIHFNVSSIYGTKQRTSCRFALERLLHYRVTESKTETKWRTKFYFFSLRIFQKSGRRWVWKFVDSRWSISIYTLFIKTTGYTRCFLFFSFMVKKVFELVIAFFYQRTVFNHKFFWFF